MHSLEQDLQLVRKITGQFVRRHYGMEFDDLFSEACLIYLQASRQYDPGRGAWSTFICAVIQNRLRLLIWRGTRQEQMEYPTGTIPEWVPDETESEKIYIAQENWDAIWESLSPKARSICQILLYECDVYLPMDRRRKCRGILFRLLRERGWDWDSIWNGFREIRQVLKTSII